jgi:membrane protein DedA with SNARE-associated domain
VYAVLGVLAAVENIFPPVPADVAAAVGGFLSSGGQVSARAVFLVTWAANVAGAAGVYLAARHFGRPFFRGRVGQRLIRPAAFERLERLYARYGSVGIFLSRFIPGVRSIVPPFAGVAGLSTVRALTPTVVASGLWYALLTWLGAQFAHQIQDVVRFADHLNAWSVVVVLAVVGVLGSVVVWRRRHRSFSQP